MVDQYPQWLNCNTAAETTAGTYAETETQLPVRISDRQVLEVLGVEFEVAGGEPAGLDTDKTSGPRCHVSRRSRTGIHALNQPDCIDMYRHTVDQEFAEAAETGGAGSERSNIEWHDFAAGAKGFLVASQSVFVGVIGSANNVVVNGAVRILYRLVKVSAEELIGLVQQ